MSNRNRPTGRKVLPHYKHLHTNPPQSRPADPEEEMIATHNPDSIKKNQAISFSGRPDLAAAGAVPALREPRQLIAAVPDRRIHIEIIHAKSKWPLGLTFAQVQQWMTNLFNDSGKNKVQAIPVRERRQLPLNVKTSEALIKREEVETIKKYGRLDPGDRKAIYFAVLVFRDGEQIRPFLFIAQDQYGKFLAAVLNPGPRNKGWFSARQTVDFPRSVIRGFLPECTIEG